MANLWTKSLERETKHDLQELARTVADKNILHWTSKTVSYSIISSNNTSVSSRLFHANFVFLHINSKNIEANNINCFWHLPSAIFSGWKFIAGSKLDPVFLDRHPCSLSVCLFCLFLIDRAISLRCSDINVKSIN